MNFHENALNPAKKRAVMPYPGAPCAALPEKSQPYLGVRREDAESSGVDHHGLVIDSLSILREGVEPAGNCVEHFDNKAYSHGLWSRTPSSYKGSAVFCS